MIKLAAQACIIVAYYARLRDSKFALSPKTLSAAKDAPPYSLA